MILQSKRDSKGRFIKGNPSYMKGVPCSEYKKRRISETHKGMKMPREIVERIRLKNLGRKHSDEVKKKISQASKRFWQNGVFSKTVWNGWNKGLKGEKSHLWKGGRKLRDKIYRQNHKEQISYWRTIREARIRGAGGKYTLQEWQNLKKRCNFTCLGCGRKEPEISLTVDHIVPVSQGGSNDISNIQPLCQSCNSKKRNKTINYLKIYEMAL